MESILVAANPRSVGFSAFRLGADSLCWRQSSHSFSGAVVAVAFSSQDLAGSFSKRWQARVNYFCAVRHVAGHGWVVSVPASVAPPAGVFVRCRGVGGGGRAISRAVEVPRG